MLASILGIIEQTRRSNPDAEFILVSRCAQQGVRGFYGNQYQFESVLFGIAARAGHCRSARLSMHGYMPEAAYYDDRQQCQPSTISWRASARRRCLLGYSDTTKKVINVNRLSNEHAKAKAFERPASAGRLGQIALITGAAGFALNRWAHAPRRSIGNAADHLPQSAKAEVEVTFSASAAFCAVGISDRRR